eukprot:CAMPEP_0182851470 /NCGR_PEP_ID=MMETSP0006_2-20121128/30644_1 /TAXON_ID=97485 /ORGANISM="Prymnesium parvum, Strain Texoma1" /LENGTH=116 /DNA_ID=CAMNT_0024982143 /DNA_START=52 /DNA_END=402 /DNA_ORIENTATION=-
MCSGTRTGLKGKPAGSRACEKATSAVCLVQEHTVTVQPAPPCSVQASRGQCSRAMKACAPPERGTRAGGHAGGAAVRVRAGEVAPARADIARWLSEVSAVARACSNSFSAIAPLGP